MSALREPGLGPVVGHTTHTTCRIWIKCADPGERVVLLYPDRRTVGEMVLTEVNGKAAQNLDVF